MSASTSIEWTDTTWNPVRGCSIVSPGCRSCYAMKQAHRFSGPGKPYEGLTKQTKAGPQWTGKIVTVEEALTEPLSWKKPRRVFVNSMSDLFHEDVPDEFIDRVFAVMALCPQHTFQVLTKRPERMLRYCRTDDSSNREYEPDLDGEATRDALIEGSSQALYAKSHSDDPSMWLAVHQPLPNVWLGVSVEDQQRADERIPLLLQTPAAVRFISAEPLLGPIDLHSPVLEADSDDYLDWVIVGGESGPGARRCDVSWVRSIAEQCRAAHVPVFVKQLGAFIVDRNDAGFMGDEPDHWPEDISFEDRVEHDLDGTRDGYQGAPVRIHLNNRKGGDPSEWPEDLRVREFPSVEVPA